MMTLGQIISSVEKQELIQLETTLTNLFSYKEQIILKPNMITTHTTDEMDVDIEVINPLMVFLILFSSGTYAGIGTKCVESENLMKSTQ